MVHLSLLLFFLPNDSRDALIVIFPEKKYEKERIVKQGCSRNHLYFFACVLHRHMGKMFKKESEAVERYVINSIITKGSKND